MNREIKFRGVRIDTKEILYGSLSVRKFKNETELFIRPFNSLKSYQIIINSVGQYTGLKDKNGKEIYEGDVVKFRRKIEIVEFKNGGFCMGYIYFSHTESLPEIIGNIYDNPELLEGK